MSNQAIDILKQHQDRPLDANSKQEQQISASELDSMGSIPSS